MKDSVGFHKRLALLLRVLLQLSGGNTVSDLRTVDAINPGTHKKAFCNRVHNGPSPHASSCWAVEVLLQMVSISMFACQQCQTIQGLLHLLYVYNGPVCVLSEENPEVKFVSTTGKGESVGAGIASVHQQISIDM